MIEAVVLAFVAGGLVGVSRQLNGRLAVSTSALFAFPVVVVALYWLNDAAAIAAQAFGLA